MEFYEVIRSRRSIRRYLDTPVPQDVLLRVLEAARLAPSWKNQQCWRFLVLADPEKRARAFDSLAETNPGRKALAQAPLIVVVCADPAESGVEEGKEYYLADAALAFSQLCLAATAEGLGSCWIGWFDEARLKKELGIPPGLRVVGMTPLGYPDQQPNARPRKPLTEIAFSDEWGNHPW